MDRQALEQEISLEDDFALLDERASAVYLWRLAQLQRAGYSEEYAVPLADDHLIDLHLACDLVRHGCPERTAYLILS